MRNASHYNSYVKTFLDSQARAASQIKIHSFKRFFFFFFYDDNIFVFVFANVAFYCCRAPHSHRFYYIRIMYVMLLLIYTATYIEDYIIAILSVTELEYRPVAHSLARLPAPCRPSVLYSMSATFAAQTTKKINRFIPHSRFCQHRTWFVEHSVFSRKMCIHIIRGRLSAIVKLVAWRVRLEMLQQ